MLEQINIANEQLHESASAATDDAGKSTTRPRTTNVIPKTHGPAKKNSGSSPRFGKKLFREIPACIFDSMN
jgi:hypothetical protein